MHVKDLHVTRYGPMTPFEHDGFGAFTVIYGHNEQGKTLLIDALLKLLFKKALKRTTERRFGNMKRVSEQPEGYVVLRSHADEIKLEGDDTLSTVFPVEIGPDDFRNVFLVRDSDLHMLDERDYYAAITERLTGLRSSEIDALLKIVQNKGRLRTIAADSALANSVEHDKIADRIRSARRLVEDIQKLRDELAFARFDELTDELVDVRLRGRRLAEERDRVRAAEKRRQFARARVALSELIELERELETMRAVDAAKLRQWQRVLVEREHLQKEVAQGEQALDKRREEGKRADGDLEARRSASAEAVERLRTVEKELSSRVDEYQHARLEYRRADAVSGLSRKGFIAAGALLALALVAYTITPSNLIGAVGAVALLAALGTGWSVVKHRRVRGDLDRRAEHICGDAARLGIKVDTVLDLQSAIGDLERETNDVRADERVQEEATERIRAEIGRLDERLVEGRARIAAIDGAVASLKAETGAATPDDYQAAIDRRQSLEHSSAARREVLQGLVPVSSTGADAIAEWRAAVDRALSGGEDAPGAGEDAERGARLDREIKELEARAGDVAARLTKGGKQLYSVQTKASDLKILDETPRCRTLHDLDHLAGQIEGYCQRIEHEQAIAQQVIALFLDIDARERERVGELFGATAPVSAMFREITDGRYRTVTYDVEQNQICVEQNNGKVLRATALSGGAFDQLYLAIRLGIAERLLPASKGFFIMDDPFIKADADRLARQLDTLRRFVRGGWQILYFTAKKEVLDVLSADIQSGDVRLIELGRDLFSGATWNESPTTHSRTT